MPIGDNMFGGIPMDLSILLDVHGKNVQVERHSQDQDVPRDMYGAPLDAPAIFSTRLLFIERYLTEKDTIGGGKRKEVLVTIGAPGSLQENDILTNPDNSKKYDVVNVGNAVAGGTAVMETYTALREVDY